MRNRLIGLTTAATFAGLLAVGPGLATTATAHDRTIVVRAGDTLTVLAHRYGVSIEQLVALNHLADANRIYAGQQLVIDANATASVSKATPSSAARATARQHLVRPGEHLTGIARQYGTTIQAIVAANGIANPSYIRAGQRLVIPGAAPAPAAASPAPPAPPPAPAPASLRTHRVAPGEHLTGIAQRYGTSIAAIVEANGISNPRYIRAGQVLRIPIRRATTSQAAGASTSALPPSMASLVASRDAVRRSIVGEAKRLGVPPALALAVAWQESGWRQNVVSHAGAIGVMQLLPATGDWVGQVMLGQRVDVRDQASNIRAGVRLLAHYLDRYGGDRAKALAAYYQGQTAVDRHGIYSVSRPYIASILRLEQLFD